SGVAELRTMQRHIERHTRKQLASSTLKENLSLLFDQFAERIGRSCYSQLVHARLPSRLAEAKRAAGNELGRIDLQEKMQNEVMHRDPSLAPETAMARVHARLETLIELLHEIEPLADAIDRRTAEFARRSQARFRYLQETTSENRARVQTFFETLNRHFGGKRVAELDELEIEFPALLLHETRIIGGVESLYTPHLRKAAGEIEPMEDEDTLQHDRALARLENTMRDSLTVSRANRFVAALPGEAGARLDSKNLLEKHIHNDEDIADLIACLLHARSAGAKYRVEVQREITDADAAKFNKKLNYRIEQFALVKK
ncbi:MAG: Wadjet anti-phage system protein JetA family protein, partial [Limisphaerales bacterium]